MNEDLKKLLEIYDYISENKVMYYDEEEVELYSIDNIDYEIGRVPKDEEDYRELFRRARENIRDCDLFYLYYHEGHPDYNYNVEHYHISTLMLGISQLDIMHLIEDILHEEVDGYLSSNHYGPGLRIHLFGDFNQLESIVEKLNNLFLE